MLVTRFPGCPVARPGTGEPGYFARGRMIPMSDDELKAVLAELKRDLSQAFRIEAEDINHKIELVAEGVSGLREAVSREFTDIRERVEAVRGEVRILEGSTH